MPRCLNPNCKDKFTDKYFLQKYCMVKTECIGLYLESTKAKRQKQIKKDIDNKVKIFKENLHDYEAEARKYFQKWIRIRDKNEGCVSCGKKDSAKYDGGHWWKAELYSGLIFHEWNCNKQCSRPCNKDLMGDPSNYRIGLVKKIGLENVLWIEENKDRLRQYKFSKQELINITNKYKLKLKESK